MIEHLHTGALGVRCSSMVKCLLIVQWFIRLLTHGGHMKLLIVPTSAILSVGCKGNVKGFSFLFFFLI